MPDTRRSLSALQAIINDNSSGDISAADVRDVLVSVDGENSCQTAAMASEPASSLKAGDQFWPNDGFYHERYSGSAWAPWGPIFPLTKPIDGDFAWINQGTATVITTNGGIYLRAVAGAGTENYRIRKKAAPATPYTITAAMLPNIFQETGQYPGCGIGWRQSSDGKLVIIRSYNPNSAGIQFGILKASSPTSGAANYIDTPNPTVGNHGPLWLRISDDGTNRKVSVSSDGQNWTLLHTVGRTDYLTADEVCFYCNTSATFDQGVTLLSWKET